MKLYDNIKRLRKEKGWSQPEMAKRVGYTDRTTISKIEAGLIDLPQSKITAFAKAFGVSEMELMYGYEITIKENYDELINYIKDKKNNALKDINKEQLYTIENYIDFIIKK